MSQIKLKKNELLRAEQLVYFKGDYQILNNVWIHILEGEILGLAGLDNSGKTTLAKILSGIHKLSHGQLTWRGSPLSNEVLGKLKDHVIYLESPFGLIDNLSVYENLFIIRRPSRRIAERERSLKQAFSEIRRHGHLSNEVLCVELKRLGLNFELDTKVSALDASEKLHLAVLKWIYAGKALLILNCQVSVNRDRELEQLARLFASAKRAKISILLLTNEIGGLTRLCDRIVVLRSGRSVANLHAPFNNQEIFTTMSGKLVTENIKISRRRAPEPGQETLRIRELSSGVLDHVNLFVQAHEVVGVVSLSEQWNNDLMSLLMGETKPISGEIFRNNLPASRRLLKQFSTTKNRSCFLGYRDLGKLLFNNLSTGINLLMLAQKKAFLWPLGIKNRKLRSYLDKIDGKALGISKQILEKPVRQLSNKERYQLLMARIRLFNPDLLVADRLLERADVLQKRALIDSLYSCAKRGAGVLVLSSNIRELMAFCERIYLVGRGASTRCITHHDYTEEIIGEYMN